MKEFIYNNIETIVFILFLFFIVTSLSGFIISRYKFLKLYSALLVLSGLLLIISMIMADSYDIVSYKSNEKAYSVIAKVHDDKYQLVLEDNHNHHHIVEVRKSDYQRIKENHKVKLFIYEKKAVLNQ